MGLIDRVNSWVRASAIPPYVPQPDNWWSFVNMNGNSYPLSGMSQTITGNVEDIDSSFEGLVNGAYRTNGIVFACMLARLQLFTEARFQFQRLRGGRPGDLFGDASLSILETPWPNGNTGDLLARMITDADLAGNFFGVRRRNAIRRLRPDWVTIVIGSMEDPDVQAGDPDAEVLGYIYHPGGRMDPRPAVPFLRSEVAHFAPIPDPLAWFRGMSWLTPVIREITADKQMTDHKSQYLVNGATPNLTVAIDKDLKESANPTAFKEWVEAFKATNSTNAWDKYTTWYLAGGTVVTKVGDNLGSDGVNFKEVQGAGETRIAAAAGVPPVIVGLSEGLQAATYSNYGQARRRFADGTMRPLWRNAAGSLEDIVPPPGGSRLWYDDRDIQALAEDKKDLAEVRQLETQQIRTLVDGGYTPESVTKAVIAGDFSLLVHTGLYSVQLQPPGSLTPTPEPVAIPAVVPKREELLLEALRYAAARPMPEMRMIMEPGAISISTPDIHVDATTTVAEGAVVVTTPEVRNEISVEPTPLEVRVENTVEPTPVEVRVENSIDPTPVEVHLPEPKPVTKTIKRDESGAITHIEES